MFEKEYIKASNDKKSKWHLKKLEDVFVFQEGPGIRNWQYVKNGVNFINIRCIQDNDINTDTMNKISEEEAYGIYKHFLLKEWDLVISTSGTLGRFAIVRKEHLPLCLNTSIIRFYPKIDFSHYSFMYAYLTSPIFEELLKGFANGSAQLNFGPTHLKLINILYPDNDTILSLNRRIFPCLEKICNIRRQNEKLNELKQLYLKKFFG